MITNDLRFAARTLRNNPAFTITAILTIALGIGASTAIFSVVNALLLRPLPYAHPAQLVAIQSDMRARHVDNFPFPPGDVPDIRARATAFEDIGGVSSGPVPFSPEDGKPEMITTAAVTTNFFTLLGAKIGFGRNFVDADGAPPARQGGNATQTGIAAAGAPAERLPTMAILSSEFWHRRFAGDSHLIADKALLHEDVTRGDRCERKPADKVASNKD